GEGVGDTVDRPRLEEYLPARQQPAGRPERGGAVRGQRGPADRAEKPDRVVLDAVPLPVAGDQVLALAVLAGARVDAGPAAQQREHGQLEHGMVLPGNG